MIRERILSLYERGLPVAEIADRVKRSTATVYLVTRSAGATRPQRFHSSVLAALEAAEDFLTAGEIAAAIGAPDTSRWRISNSVSVLSGRGHRIQSKLGPNGGYRLIQQQETKS